MKAALLSLFTLTCALALSSCYMATLPPGPGFGGQPLGYNRPFHPGHHQPGWQSPGYGVGVWQTGYDYGRSDRMRGLNYYPARYRSRVSEKHRANFYAGYRDGYYNSGGGIWRRR
ncbi:MAG TPA: hypothetical protein DIT13_00500 [Verrucomicrobiales bacterium]|nr:hypothetical protein [Verrucomicrobiales bacterium]HRJ09859.1 hypothetical protein [Prosthecobacter sp.]HRK16105.1 hypothetical protein [Prosthecobacter sp.]